MSDKEKKNDVSSNENIDNKAEGLSEEELENVTGGKIRWFSYWVCMDCKGVSNIFTGTDGKPNIEHAPGCPANNVQFYYGPRPLR